MGEQNVDTEIVEFEDADTAETIQKEYEDWVWNKIGDDFSWDEIEEGEE